MTAAIHPTVVAVMREAIAAGAHPEDAHRRAWDAIEPRKPSRWRPVPDNPFPRISQAAETIAAIRAINGPFTAVTLAGAMGITRQAASGRIGRMIHKGELRCVGWNEGGRVCELVGAPHG